MKSKKDPGVPTGPNSGFSRRGFIGVGLGSGALGAGLLETPAIAGPAGAAVVGPQAVPVTLNINGKPVNLTLEPRVTLLDALRNYIGLTGAKKVCDRGNCGACTVMLSGKTVYACSVLAIDAQGKEIQTIEGLAAPGELHPVSAAFWNHDAQQCGYCTPGFVVTAKALLDRNIDPTEEEIREELAGNLCRCGTYPQHPKAVLEAARKLRVPLEK